MHITIIILAYGTFVDMVQEGSVLHDGFTSPQQGNLQHLPGFFGNLPQ
jgi:hypothetical protein